MKRKSRSNQDPIIKRKPNDSLELQRIKPLTKNQQSTFDSYYSDKNLLLIGSAGTGKSFLSCYLAIKDILSDDTPYDNLVIIRSAVSSRDIGFLPGNQKEKMTVYELPYKQIFTDLFNRGDAYEILTRKDKVRFESTSFLRGTTFRNCIILFDEFQNSSFAESSTIITRIGDDCKIIVSGDFRQSDLHPKYKGDETSQGSISFANILRRMSMFDTIEFGHSDIVRSELVKSFIIESEKEC